MKRFRRRKSIKLVLAFAVAALVLVPLAQAQPDMYPGANVVQATPPGTIHGVPTSLYQRLPVDDQAALAGTGKIGGFAGSSTVAPKTIHGVPASLYQRLPVDDQAALAGTGKIGGYAVSTDQAPKSQPVAIGNDFSWGTAGIGFLVAGVAVLAILSVAVVTRRGRGGLAQA